jgi:hypothetical protein
MVEPKGKNATKDAGQVTTDILDGVRVIKIMAGEYARRRTEIQQPHRHLVWPVPICHL